MSCSSSGVAMVPLSKRTCTDPRRALSLPHCHQSVKSGDKSSEAKNSAMGNRTACKLQQRLCAEDQHPQQLQRRDFSRSQWGYCRRCAVRKSFPHL